MRTFRLPVLTLMLMLSFFSVAAQDECPPSQFSEWGAIGVVTPGDANNLRAEPSVDAEIVGRVPPGEPFRVLYSSIACADGFLWREIQSLTLRGWTVEIPVDGDDPFIIPYEQPEPREIGQPQEDGSILVEESGVRFVVPAALNVAQVTVEPEVGLFGDVMSAQPSSAVFSFVFASGHVQQWLEIYPYAVSEVTEAYWDDSPLNTILVEQPVLTDPAIRRSLPQTPLAGSAALFRGAPQYVPFASGNGVRYITYFAQTSVIFDSDNSFTYLYRGISADRSFFITAELGVSVPAETIPAPAGRDEVSYPRYLAQFEANLDATPTSAYTPDLAVYDVLLASLVLGNPQDVMRLIP